MNTQTKERNVIKITFPAYEACQQSGEKLRKLGFKISDLQTYYEDF